MRRVVFVGTNGPEDPTKAVMPFVLAVGATMAKEPIEPALVLLGDAVSLMKDEVVPTVLPVGYPPLSDVFPKLLDRRVPIYV